MKCIQYGNRYSFSLRTFTPLVTIRGEAYGFHGEELKNLDTGVEDWLMRSIREKLEYSVSIRMKDAGVIVAPRRRVLIGC